MFNIISQTTSIGEAKEILELHNISLGNFWEFAIGGMLQECDHIEIQGYGSNAKLVKINETLKEDT